MNNVNTPFLLLTINHAHVAMLHNNACMQICTSQVCKRVNLKLEILVQHRTSFNDFELETNDGVAGSLMPMDYTCRFYKESVMHM